MASVGIEVHHDELAAFCKKWKVRELAFFGSVLRDDFGPASDVDVLATFEDDAPWGLLDIIRAEEELQALFGRAVDLMDRRSVEKSENWIRRRQILSTARTIYG